jgi:predicted cation transporter
MTIPLYVVVGLIVILVCIFISPFIFRHIEHNLEVFLLIMGVLSVTLSNLWSKNLILESLTDPVKLTHPIVEVVFVSGLIFRFFRDKIKKNINKLANLIGFKLFIFLLVVILGVFSSVITAIIASLILVEVISTLKLDKRNEVKLVVLTCFSIGLGAVLTPVGEPLATIAVAKLTGEPHNAGSLFLFNNLWYLVIPGIILFGLFAAFYCKNLVESGNGLTEDKPENFYDICLRALKVYFFIMALVLLGKGFEPIINNFIVKLHPGILYWINISSAILDNATLTAAEISPSMSIEQIRFILMGLLVSGGMLIPGNIPNIIAANKLGIKSSEWAKIGLPVGFVFLLIYFFVLLFISI